MEVNEQFAESFSPQRQASHALSWDRAKQDALLGRYEPEYAPDELAYKIAWQFVTGRPLPGVNPQ